jgi:hypothetical protein
MDQQTKIEGVTMRNQITRVVVGAVLPCLVAALATSGIAQRRGPRGRVYTRAEVNELIKRAENRSDVFVKLFDSAMDKSALDGTKREDRLNERVKHLENALDELRKEFDRKESYIETKLEMRRVLNIASEINRVMHARRLGASVESEWALLRRELNVLASVYFLPSLRS